MYIYIYVMHLDLEIVTCLLLRPSNSAVAHLHVNSSQSTRQVECHSRLRIAPLTKNCVGLFIRRCVSVGMMSDAISAGSSCDCVCRGESLRRLEWTPRPCFGLYKILFHFKALVHELIILILPSRPASPTRLQYYCTTIAHIRPPPPPPLAYAMHHTILVGAISCKGQAVLGVWCPASQPPWRSPLG